MGLREELGFPRPVETASHEAALNIMVTASLLIKAGERLLAPYGVTEAQFNVLMLLRHQSEEGTLDQTALGRMLVVNRSNVTALVDRMERAALVLRSPDPSDRRVKRVSLTPRGMEVAEASEGTYFRRVEEVFGALGAGERKNLVRALERVRTALAETSASV